MEESKLPKNINELTEMGSWDDIEFPRWARERFLIPIAFLGGAIILILMILSSSLVFNLPAYLRNYIIGFGLWLFAGPFLLFTFYIGVKQYKQKHLLWGISGGLVFLIGFMVLSIMALMGFLGLQMIIVLVVITIIAITLSISIDIIRGKLQDRCLRREGKNDVI